MTIYSWASYNIRPPSRMVRDRRNPEARMISPFSQALQSSERAGQHWRLELEWLVYGEERDELEALMTRLNGTEHRIGLPMFDLLTGVKTNRGTFSGTPVINGAGQTGYEIQVAGGAENDPNFALPGDFLQFDSAIRMVTARAGTDGIGEATIPIWPPIRTSPANGTALKTSANVEGVYYVESIAPTPLEDVLARGEVLSPISAVFVDDVNA